jgi:hypothetical protein
MFAGTIVKPFGSAEAVAARSAVYDHKHELGVSPRSFYAFYQLFEWHRVKVGGKQVVEGLFLVACISLGACCLHKGCMYAAVDNRTARTCRK